MKKLVFITSNKGKALEAQKKFMEIKIDVIQKNLGYPEIQADNLEDVASFGVIDLQKRFKQPFMIEDAGLFIKSLNGFPGVYSAYVFHTIGCKGILKLMENIKKPDRKAVFRSVIAYSEPNKKTLFFVGECYGEISSFEKGENGFGYDPIFIPDNETKTFGQMSTVEKNCFSHRGKSLQKLIDFFKK